ncbi:MAG: hypothetical protein P4M14_13520 [Gammaproteobacteria bacterium]|nr:hypothetical protein [Gammaproteobacteria bacterium]
MNTVTDFKKQGYIVIRNLVDSKEVERLYHYTLQNVGRGNLDDGQVPGSPSFYQDKEVVLLQAKCMEAIQSAIQVKLLTVFCYHRVYRAGAILKAHKDSSRAQISASVNLGQKGEPWDLWLLDYEENTRKITLNPGDALVYHGSKLMHWREKLVSSDFVSQVMFHFVTDTFKNSFVVKSEMIRKFRKRCRKLLGVDY